METELLGLLALLVLVAVALACCFARRRSSGATVRSFHLCLLRYTPHNSDVARTCQ